MLFAFGCWWEMAWKYSPSILISRVSYGSAYTSFIKICVCLFACFPTLKSIFSRNDAIKMPKHLHRNMESQQTARCGELSRRSIRLGLTSRLLWLHLSLDAAAMGRIMMLSVWLNMTRRGVIPARTRRSNPTGRSEMKETIEQTAWRQALQRAKWQREYMDLWIGVVCCGRASIRFSAFGVAYGQWIW